MNTTVSAIKLIVLCAIVAIGFIGMIAEPTSAETSTKWLAAFIASKAVSLAAFYIAYRLCYRWATDDPLLQAIEKYCQKTLDEENPSQLS